MGSLIIRVEFPALDNLVDFLKSRQQSEIDALVAKVSKGTADLKESSADLQGSVETQPQ